MLRLPSCLMYRAAMRCSCLRNANTTHPTLSLPATPARRILQICGGGISGLLIKSGFDEEVVVALNTLAEGGTYRNCDVATNLTDAERAVLRYLASGWNNQAIAEALHLSKGTVMNRVSAILSKLGCANRTQAALWYLGMQPIFGMPADIETKG